MTRPASQRPPEPGFARWRALRLRRLADLARAVGGRRRRRNPLPADLVEAAQVPGYADVRFWGDIYSPTFERVLIDKDTRVRETAEAGISPERLATTEYLSISGGGDRGAFAAGVLAGWSERGDRPSFETVVGISAGALAAPFAFLGQACDASLREIFTRSGPAQLYKARGVLGFFGDALNDTTPLEALIRRYATQAFLDRIAEEHQKGRLLFVMTTNLDAQRPVIWCLSAIAASGRVDRQDLFVDVLRASSAMPGLFPPVRVQVETEDGRSYDELHVDGGVTAELIFVPPESRVLTIEDQVFGRHRARTLYVIENGKLQPEYAAVEPRLLALTRRAVSTLVKYQVLDNLIALGHVMKATEGKFRFTAVPADFDVVAASPFDTAYASALFEAGRTLGLSGNWQTSPPLSPRLGHLDGADTTHRAMATIERRARHGGVPKAADERNAP